MSRNSDVELVRRAQRGDERAFDTLMRRELPVVFSAVARLLPYDDVEDVVQETLIKAFRNFADLRELDKLRPWLLTIALREARRHAQASSTSLNVAGDPQDRLPVDAQERAVARLTLAEQRKEVAAATEWLDPDDREIFALWWLELLGEMDRAGLVAAAGGTPNHVAVRLRRLRDRLPAVRTLVRAIAAQRRPGSCVDFRRLAAEWNGSPSSVWRKRFTNHISQCSVCGSMQRDLVAPELLLSTTPLLVVPAGMAASQVVPAVLGKTVGAFRRLLHLGKAGISQPAVAVATSVVVLGSAATVAYAVRPTSAAPLAQAEAAVSPAAPGRAVPSASPTASVSPSVSPSSRPSSSVVFGGPVTITKGGTYRGNWRSTDPKVPAVSIRTSEPVVLQGCQVRGPGDLISARFSDSDAQVGIDLTVRDCRGVGEDPKIAGKARGFFLVAVWPRKMTVENNFFEHTRGVSLVGDNKPGTVQSIRVVRNRVRDVDGRVTGASCSRTLNTYAFPLGNGQCGANAIGINGFHRVRDGIDIGWNEVINTAGRSSSEDSIIVYNSSGTAQVPIRVHDNYVQGAYPLSPTTDRYSGSGINIADSSADVDPARAPAFVRGENNQIVSTANVGIFIAAGHNNVLIGNRVVSSGQLPDGRRIKNFFTGIYVWDCCYRHVGRGIWKNNIAVDNTVGYTTSINGRAQRYDYKLDHCPPGRCTGNTSIPGAITRTSEKDEYRRWQNKIRTTGTTIGPH